MKNPSTKRLNNRRIAIISALFVIGMFGFGYALVPIYNALCKSLGINGKMFGGASAASTDDIDYSRTITVQFLATRNMEIPWKFHPLVTTIKVHPGENTKTAFYAENETNNDMIVQAIPSITPSIATKYLKKTECFCFAQQMMKGKQGMTWPLLFHIDRELPQHIRTVTLSYTLFDVTKTAKKVAPKLPGRIPS
jgi:cytochrome c oxidase assembly protein subunit 11